MGLCGVTLVDVPGILGVFTGQRVHIVVAVSLGKNARRGNGQILAVALDDGVVWYETVGLEAVAVNYDGLGTHLQLVKRTVHGQYAGVKYVYLVYLFRRNYAYGPRQCVALNLVAQLVTAHGC